MTMLHLLKIEWLKLKSYRAFIILSVLFILSVAGINFIVHAVMEVSNSGEMGQVTDMIVGKPFAFPNVWHTVSYISSFLLFIPGLIIILLMSNEYSFKTHRQNIIDGVSRGQFIGTKIGLLFIFSFCVALIVAVTAIIFGVQEKGSSFMMQGFKYIPYLFIQSIVYMSVAMLLVLLFKRSGLSIGVYFLYMFILEEVLVALANRYIHKGIGSFLPLESGDKLVPFPISLGMITGENQTTSNETYVLIACCTWIVLILGYCVYRFRKKDL
jgi:hypothetical protein